MRRGVIVAMILAVATAAACGAFSGADSPAAPDAGSSDTGVGETDGGGVDGSASDGGVTNARCNPTAAFGQPVLLGATVNTAVDEPSAALSEDEKTIYFSRQLSGGNRDLFVASRTSIDADFGAAQPINALNSPRIDDGIVVSNDGLLAVFHSNRPDGGAHNIFFATRGSTINGFGTPTDIATVNTPSFTEHDAYLLPNKTRLYFGSDRNGPVEVFVSNVDVAGSIATFSIPKKVDGLGEGSGSPVVSADEREIFFASFRGDDAGLLNRIYRATRASNTGAFANVEEVTVLNDPKATTVPSWLSSDGCVLYFSSNRSGNREIYVATRGK